MKRIVFTALFLGGLFFSVNGYSQVYVHAHVGFGFRPRVFCAPVICAPSPVVIAPAYDDAYPVPAYYPAYGYRRPAYYPVYRRPYAERCYRGHGYRRW